MRKQDLSDKCIGVVYDAIVLNMVLYALSGWGIHKPGAKRSC